MNYVIGLDQVDRLLVPKARHMKHTNIIARSNSNGKFSSGMHGS